MKINTHLPKCSNAPPISDDRVTTEKVGLNGDRVEPLHVRFGFDPEEHGMIVVICHAELSHDGDPATNEFGESMTIYRFMPLIDANSFDRSGRNYV